jgi:MFS family permease
MQTGRKPQRRPSPRTVLAIASLGGVVAFIDATIVNIAVPDVARSFPGTSISALSWVFNAYNIVFAAFLMAAAGLADLLGRRRVFIAGLELFTVGSLLCAIAPSADALVAFRVVQALGAALLVPSALALVLNAFPAARRSHGVALLSATGAAAAGFGPSLGGLLVAAANWRLVFLVNVPIGVAAVLLARRRLVENRAPGRRRVPDLPGTLLFAPAIGALVLGVVKGQEWGWGSARIIGCLAAAFAFGAAVVWRRTWHRSPIIDLSLLKIRTVSAANAMTVVGAAGFYGYTLANVLFLTGLWRYSVLQAGLALTVGPAVAAVVAGPTSRLAQRIAPARSRGRGPGVGRGGDVARRAGRADARLRRPVAAGHGPARSRRGHAVSEPQRHRGRLGAGRELRDGNRDELGRAPDRSRSRRRDRRGDHRDPDAGDSICGVSACLDVRCGLPVRRRARAVPALLPPRRAAPRLVPPPQQPATARGVPLSRWARRPVPRWARS